MSPSPLRNNGRQMEFLPVPFARKILRAALDVTVVRDQTRTPDADQRRELAPVPFRKLRKTVQHRDDLARERAPARRIVRMAPHAHRRDAHLRDTMLARTERDDPAAHVRAAEIDREHRVESFEQSTARRDARRPPSPASSGSRSIVRSSMRVFDSCRRACARGNHEPADAAFAEAAADRKALDTVPRLHAAKAVR